MAHLRRWTAAVVSRFDNTLARIENHEGLVNVALRDMQAATARAQVQLRRVRADGKQLQQRLDQARADADLWRDRARRQHDNDQQAIECLRRSRRASRRVADLGQRLIEHEQSERQLVKDVSQLEERLLALCERRNLMRLRQSRAEASKVVDDCQPLGEVGEIFDRWEYRVAETELVGHCTTTSQDSFEEQLDAEEEQAELHQELEELRGPQ